MHAPVIPTIVLARRSQFSGQSVYTLKLLQFASIAFFLTMEELCGDLLLLKRAHDDENRNIEQTPGKWVVLDSSVAESADVIIDIGRDDEVAEFRTADDLTPGGERQTWHRRLRDDIGTLYLTFLQLADLEFGCHMKPIHSERWIAASQQRFLLLAAARRLLR